jgi:hydroxyacylglutathione hydrolase
MSIRVIPIETAGLGDRSYLAHDGHVAVVIDPQRDIDRVVDLAAVEGVQIAMVLETHIHNDYVSGGLALSRATGATYVMNADDPVEFERHGVRDSEVLHCGSMWITALHTPGHTFTHMSYALADSDDHTVGVFTGGGLLHGATGRPDLLGQEHAETLARHQHASARRLADALPVTTAIHPTHGFGSFCSSTSSQASLSTIADEIDMNPVLRDAVDVYVRDLLDGLDVYPAYYKYMGPMNASGPEDIDLSLPERATSDDIRTALERNHWVVDLRNRTAFVDGHVRGSYSFGLDGSFATYFGWLFPYDTSIVLLGETAEQVAEAQRELVRIGIDRIDRMATGQVDDWTRVPETTPVRSFSEVPEAFAADALVLDIRRISERRAAHVEGTVHLPMHELLTRMHELPRDRQIWVHCASAYRASIAASVMQAEGLDAVIIMDPFEAAETVDGLHIVRDVDVRASVAPSDVFVA